MNKKDIVNKKVFENELKVYNKVLLQKAYNVQLKIKNIEMRILAS